MIARSRSFVDWQNRRGLVEDLQTQRRAIVDHVGKTDPKEALDLMWGLMALASSVSARCDDSSGTVIGIFHDGVSDLGRLAEAAKSDAKDLADRAFQALLDNDYGQFDHLIPTLSAALGDAGLEHLKSRLVALSKEPAKKPAEHERRKIGWSTDGPIYQDEIASRHRNHVVEMALRDIADAQNDVDAFIAQYDPATRKVPRIAAGIAERLLAASRAAEALQTIEAAEHKRSDWPELEWEDARVAALQGLERSGDAQAARWSCFERFLSARHLRDYLKRLPDFEAENGALNYAENFANFPAGGSSVPGVMACVGSRGETRTGARGGIKRRSLRSAVARRRRVGQQASFGGDARLASDDRVFSRSRPIQPIQTRRAPFAGMRQSRLFDCGFQKMGIT